MMIYIFGIKIFWIKLEIVNLFENIVRKLGIVVRILFMNLRLNFIGRGCKRIWVI